MRQLAPILNEFVLDSAMARAEDRPPDRRTFRLNAEEWAAFMTALNAPAREHPRLRRLLNEPSVFDAHD
jgi:uncharacterized protein (DUF1778 family)